MKKLLTIVLVLLVAAAACAQQGKKPVIGISSTWGEGTAVSAPLTYVKSVLRAGGVPVVLPITHDPELL